MAMCLRARAAASRMIYPHACVQKLCSSLQYVLNHLYRVFIERANEQPHFAFKRRGHNILP